MREANPARSERLTYAALAAEHGASLFAALSDPAVYQHIDGHRPTSVQELSDAFARMSGGPPPHRAEEAWWNVAVFDAASGRGVGRLEATLVGDRAEVAYLFGPAFWGAGLGGEALGWLHGRLREHRIATLWATTRPANVRSVRLLERLGLRSGRVVP